MRKIAKIGAEIEDPVSKSDFKRKQFPGKPRIVDIFALNAVCKRDIRFVEFVIYLLSRVARGVATTGRGLSFVSASL